MKKRKFTNIVIDIDSVFYRVGDRNLKTISDEIMKIWFNSLKENHNIYVISNRLSYNEVNKRLKHYKVNRIPQEIYCYNNESDFRRNVLDKLIKYYSVDKKFSSVLFISGNPYFVKEKEGLGLSSCYVKELNKKHLDINVGTFTVDRVSAINSLELYLQEDVVKNEEKRIKNLEITDYTYIIGSGVNLLDRNEFGENAIILNEYNDTDNNKDYDIDIENTLAVSSDLFELRGYQQQNIATLFVNNGMNDVIDMRPTFEKRIAYH